MRFKPLFTLAAVAALHAVPASAATIVNGSFESGPAVGGFTTVGAGSSAITGWTINSGSVDYIGSHWAAQDGVRSVDLAGNAIGTLSQTFATVANTIYTVSFYLARNPDGGLMPRTGTVEATGGGVQNLSYTNAGSTVSNMGWELNSYQFTANSNSTTLTFAADPTSSGFYGLALDNVSISAAVPEPATWAMMLLGFGAMGFVLRRPKTRRSARINFA